MLEQVRQLQPDIRLLRLILNWNGVFDSPEERDQVIDRIKYRVSEMLISKLMQEDKDKQNIFLNWQ